MTVVISGQSCELYDGVRETTQTTGTGSYQLDGAAVVSGQTYRTFVSVASGQRVPYVVWSGSQFERGLGTVTAGAPPTITRSTILGSSNSNNPVSWGTGVKDIWLDAPSELLDQIVAATGVDADSITNTLLANMPAWSFKIRNTTTTGDPSDAAIGNITTGTTPQASDFLLGFLSTGEIRKYTVSAVAAQAPTSSPTLLQKFTSSGTWTKPAGLDHIEVEGCGGGGGGGGVNGNNLNTAAAGGGGGGGTFKCKIAAAQLGASVSVTVGSAGNGASSGENNGGSGGTSSFGSFASGTGGSGGIGAAATGGSGVATGGDGGDTTYSGTLTHYIPPGARTGQNGFDGIKINGELAGKGMGGSSPYGAGGRVFGGNSGANQGAAGQGYGTGGAGGRSSTTDVGGGDGFAGVVFVRSYF